MMDRDTYPAHRWTQFVSTKGRREPNKDPYGFIMQECRSDTGHFYAIRSVPSVDLASGVFGARWAIVDSQITETPPLMNDEQLDVYLCGHMRTGDYTIYSLAQAYRPSAETLRAEQLLVITISEIQVARARGEGTEEDESDGSEADEVVGNAAYIPGNGGPLRIASLGVIKQKYFLAQFPNVAGAWSTGEYITSLGYNRRHAFFHRAQYVVHKVTQTMRHIRRDLLGGKRLPADQTIQNLFDEHAKGCVGGATGEQYTALMTAVRALHFVEEETLGEKSLVGFWCALPTGAKGLLVPTHFLSACRAGVNLKARQDPGIARKGIRLKTSPFLGPGSGVTRGSRAGTPAGLRYWRWFDPDAPVWGGLDADTSLGPVGSCGASEPANSHDLGVSFIHLSKESSEEDKVCRTSFTRMYCEGDNGPPHLTPYRLHPDSMRSVADRIDIGAVVIVLWRNPYERGSGTQFVARHLRADWGVFCGWSGRDTEERCALQYRLVTDYHTDDRRNECADAGSCGSVVLSYPSGVLLGQHVNGPSLRVERRSDGHSVQVDERARALRSRPNFDAHLKLRGPVWETAVSGISILSLLESVQVD